MKSSLVSLLKVYLFSMPAYSNISLFYSLAFLLYFSTLIYPYEIPFFSPNEGILSFDEIDAFLLGEPYCYIVKLTLFVLLLVDIFLYPYLYRLVNRVMLLWMITIIFVLVLGFVWFFILMRDHITHDECFFLAYLSWTS